jgi:2-polyprenyl-3-methyl-5-hydroxy-6-metoxy-1,4-benzoquinol methylase
LFLAGPKGEWIVSNPMARSHVAVSSSALELLRRLREPGVPKAAPRLWAEDRTVFGCRVCALDDATGLSPEPSRQALGLNEVLKLLEERLILIHDLASYRERLGPKTKPVDPEHAGNFHQRLGHELLFRQRTKPDDWWVSQKFTEDLSSVHDTAYRKVQEEFLRREVPGWGLSGAKVLDVGCGVGYYSKFFARHGAQVLGLDPNPDYIKRAREAFSGDDVRFEVFDFKDPPRLADFGQAAYDLIYLADVLLFYFVSYRHRPQELAGAAAFLKSLKAMLSPRGRIVVMDPHGSFSLCCRYGDPQRPLAVLTEYRRRSFGIAATLEGLGRAFREAGLAVTGMWEPCYEGDGTAPEDGFLREFPVWWVFELKAL